MYYCNQAKRKIVSIYYSNIFEWCGIWYFGILYQYLIIKITTTTREIAKATTMISKKKRKGNHMRGI